MLAEAVGIVCVAECEEDTAVAVVAAKEVANADRGGRGENPELVAGGRVAVDTTTGNTPE